MRKTAEHASLRLFRDFCDFELMRRQVALDRFPNQGPQVVGVDGVALHGYLAKAPDLGAGPAAAKPTPPPDRSIGFRASSARWQGTICLSFGFSARTRSAGSR